MFHITNESTFVADFVLASLVDTESALQYNEASTKNVGGILYISTT